jgi:putative hemolysin
MSGEMTWGWPALAVLLALSFFFSMSETAFIGSGRVRIQNLATLGNRRAQLVLSLLQSPQELIAALLVGNNLVNIMAAALATVLLGPVTASIVISAVVLVFCEILPKTLALHLPERLAVMVAVPVKIFKLAVSPIVWLLASLAQIIVWPLARKTAAGGRRFSRQELLTALGMGELEPAERRMTREILALRDARVREIMIPMNEVDAIEEGFDFPQVLDLFAKTYATRYPVYRDRPQEVVGLLLVKDLLAHLNRAQVNWRQYVRPIMRVRPDLPVDELLRDMQIGRTHMAVVVDDRGEALGIVTMEDILEEIVGEIQDETDYEEAELVREYSPGRYLVSGAVEVDDLCKIINVDLAGARPGEKLAGWFDRFCRESCKTGRRLRLGATRIVARGGGRFEIRTVVGDDDRGLPSPS